MSERLRVLLLDDEPIVGNRLKPALTKAGYDIDVFQDPRAALARLDEETYDIVVTDIHMGEVDGFSVMRHALDKSARTKVIIITGYAMISVARKAMEQGAFDFIAKPFSPGDLRDVVARAAAQSGIDLLTDPPEGDA